MLFSKSHVCFQFCFCFIVLLSALPPVRADYFSAYNRVYKAFRRFTLPIPRSALPDDQVLSTHEYYLDGNITLIEEAETKYYNGELSYEEAQNEARPAYDDSLFTFYEIIGDYMGVGIHASCKENISEVLREANEWDKAGAQAASVIMALLPSLLTFGQSHCSITIV